MDKLQKDLAEEKSYFEGCKEKLELTEKYNGELETNLEEAKSEIQKLQDNVKRYFKKIYVS